MIQRTLREIKKMVDGTGLKKGAERIFIKGASIDTRQIKAGQLFIPIKGDRFNGHDFIEKAIDNGATAALWNKNEPVPGIDFPLIFVEDTVDALQKLAKEYRMQLSTKVIGITGSNGKTSTKDILADLLKTKYRTRKTFGNLNNHLGVPLTILEIEEDTEMAVIEMGISALGETELLSSIASPDVAIITNIGEAHLTTLGTKANILQAKLEILTGLKPNGLFVYYGDDHLLRKKVPQMEINHEILTFGEGPSNSYSVIPEEIKVNGSTFKLQMKDSPTFFLPMLGKHQMYNATAAIAVARYFGVSFDLIQKGMFKVDATGMRNEIIHVGQYTILNDAYKSNPSSLRAALEVLYGLQSYKQKIVVLGDMNGIGDEEVQMHREIGEGLDPEEIHYVFTIGPLAQHIAEGAKLRFKSHRVISCIDKTQLIEKVREIVAGGSIILIKASRELELEEVVDVLKAEEILLEEDVL